MALTNLGSKHLTAAQKATIDTALASILTVLQSVSPNFSEKDRKKYGSINEQNKLVVNKANDYHLAQPALQSPDVDWTEFDLDYQDRLFADTRLNTVDSITHLLSDFKIAHDFDNLQDALTDYGYAQYKAGSNTPGFAAKVADFKPLFPRTGTAKSKEEEVEEDPTGE